MHGDKPAYRSTGHAQHRRAFIFRRHRRPFIVSVVYAYVLFFFFFSVQAEFFRRLKKNQTKIAASSEHVPFDLLSKQPPGDRRVLLSTTVFSRNVFLRGEMIKPYASRRPHPVQLKNLKRTARHWET